MISVVLLFMIGLVIGSFLNVVAVRRINEESFVSGRSKCPECSQKISWYDNIPLLSFIFLKGHCRHCNQQISLQYPFIELFSAIMTIALYDYQPNLHLGGYVYLFLKGLPDIKLFEKSVEKDISPGVFIGQAPINRINYLDKLF